MKKLFSLFVLWICYGWAVQAATLSMVGTEATVSGSTPGCLVGSALMSTPQKLMVTKLTVLGDIDARDFLVIRDEIARPGALVNLNLSGSNILSYTGTQGTNGTGSSTYPANTVPISALRDINARPLTISLPATATAIGNEAFFKNFTMTSITMPNNLTSIGVEAFTSCDQLTSIDLPASLNAINTGAFTDCRSLNTIRSYSQNPSVIVMGTNVFLNVPTSTCILKVPAGRAANYSGLAQWNSFTNISAVLGSASLSINGTEATITGSVPGCMVGTGLMSAPQKQMITKLIVSGDIDASDIKVMRDEMIALSEIDLNNANIAAYTGTSGTNGTANSTYPANTVPIKAFSNQNRFTDIKIPSSATAIDIDAFVGASALASITIPNSVLTIGTRAFEGCVQLESVDLPSSLITIDQRTFFKCNSLSSITLPSTLKYIKLAAFYQAGITSISIPSSVVTIENLAFFQCQNLASVTFIDADVSVLSSIGGQAFYMCTSLQTIEIPKNVTYLGDEVFCSSGLKTLTFAGGCKASKLERIGYSAFLGCANLQSMSFPPNMNYIDEEIFDGCTSLDTIYAYMPDPSTCRVSAFLSPSTCLLRVPTGLYSTYLNAPIWGTFLHVVEGLVEPKLKTIRMDAAGTSRALSYSELTSMGDAKSLKAGVTWSTSTNPNIIGNSYNADSELSSLSGFNNVLKDLSPGTTYYLRTFTLNNATSDADGVTYGDEISFTTPTVDVNGTAMTINNMMGGSLIDEYTMSNSDKENVKSLTITGTIHFIDFDQMKKSMPNLQYVDLSGASIVEYDGYAANVVPQNAMNGKSGLISFILPSNVSEIGVRAFYDCNSLTSISLPSSLVYIGDETFTNCGTLNAIYAHMLSPMDISDLNVFSGVQTNTCVLRVPSNQLGTYQSMNDWNNFTKIVEGFVPPTVITLFTTNITTTTAAIHGNISDFGDASPVEHGFVWSTDSNPYPTIESAQKILLGTPSNTGGFASALSGLSAGSTYYVRAFAIVPASNDVAGITYGDIVNFYTAPTVSINGTNVTISGATPGCMIGNFTLDATQKSTATSLTLSGTIDARDFKVIRDEMTALTSIDLGGAIISAYTGTEGTYSTSSTIYQPSEIPTRAFQSRPSITTFVFPITLTSIGANAFVNDYGLQNISLPASLKTIGTNAFSGCYANTTIIIPDGVTTIGGGAFRNISWMTSLSLPASVTSIGASAFSGASALTSFNVHRAIPVDLAIITNVFSSVPFSSCVMRVPNGSLSIYQWAAEWNKFTNIVEGFVKPTITTQAASNIATTSATANATISNFGDVTPIQYGVIWSTSPNPTIDLVTKTTLGVPSTTGAYTSSITGLTGNTTYYVRSYATNTASSAATGTTYGNETSFTTNNAQLTIAVPPTIVLNKIYDGNTTATLTDVGTLAGIQPADITNVTITANAGYSDPSIGTGKTITVVYTLSGPAASKYLAPANYVVTTGEIDKELKVNVILEGLWNSANGNMNQCRQSNFTPMYGSNIADLITIELHNPASYGSILYTFSDLELHQDGSVTSSGQTGIALPPSLTGTYMVTVKTRNHLETASAAGVSFSGISTTYDFRDLVGKAYESTSLFTPTKHISGKWMLYAGDSKRETFYPELNFNDLYDIFNNKSAVKGVYGYLTQDIDGDGDVTDNDLYLMFNNRDVLLYIP